MHTIGLSSGVARPLNDPGKIFASTPASAHDSSARTPHAPLISAMPGDWSDSAVGRIGVGGTSFDISEDGDVSPSNEALVLLDLSFSL